MKNEPRHALRWWGYGGAAAALSFAAWLLFFPQFVPTHFAWDVQPRLAQLFIGAGYVFRAAFFLAVAREPRWSRVRWIFWGNLAFTGTLLLATFWHAEEFLWGVFVPPTAHIWIVLYVVEPLAMLYLVPRGTHFWAQPGVGRGPVLGPFKIFLVVVAALLSTFGALLVINPDFAALRWPWELNQLDARMVAAWFFGWAVWSATMAFADDWAEIRLGAALAIVFGVALGAAHLTHMGLFTGVTTPAYLAGTVVLTLVMLGFFIVQERRTRGPRVVRERAPSEPETEATG